MNQQSVRPSNHHLFEPLLTAEETAFHLRCHPKTVQKMAREGRMPSIRQGKRYLFRLSDLDQWLIGLQCIATVTVQ
jgi:excisionase family DNA binding protein